MNDEWGVDEEPEARERLRRLVAGRLIELLRVHRVLSIERACELLGTPERPISVAHLNEILATCAHEVLLVGGDVPVLRRREDGDDEAPVHVM